MTTKKEMIEAFDKLIWEDTDSLLESWCDLKAKLLKEVQK